MCLILLGSVVVWNNELSHFCWKNKGENWFPVPEPHQLLLYVRKRFHGCHDRVLGSLGKTCVTFICQALGQHSPGLSHQISCEASKQQNRSVLQLIMCGQPRVKCPSPPDSCAWVVWWSSCEELALDPITVTLQSPSSAEPWDLSDLLLVSGGI